MQTIRRDLLLLAVLGALLFLPGLGRRDLWNPDEARYAEVAREMRDAGSWAVPRLNGEVYTQKPPLLFWSINAAALLTGGIDETSDRLPLALAAIGSLFLVYRLGERLFSRRSAWIAVAAYATCLRVLWQGRFGQIDMLLAFWVTLGVWFWVRGHTEKNPRLYPLFFLAAGVATLAKGPVGLLPPLLSILAFLALTRDRAELRRLHLGTGLLLWAVVVLAWLIPAGRAAGQIYLEQIVYKQNVTRYADPWHHFEPWYYYLTIIPADLFPWSFLLPTALVVGWRRILGGRPGLRDLAAATEVRFPSGPAQATGSGGGRMGGSAHEGAEQGWTETGPAEVLSRWAPHGYLFSLCWLVVTLLFFSISPAKRSVYILTMFPGMALMIGAALDRLATDWPKDRRWLTVPLALLAALSLLITVALPIAGKGRPEAAPLGGDRLVWELTALFALLLLGAAWAFREARRGRTGRAAAAIAVAMGLFMLVAAFTIVPRFDTVKSARGLSRILVAKLGPGETYGIYPRLDSTFLFYTGGRFAVSLDSEEKLQQFVRRPGRVWLLIQRDDLADLKRPLPPMTEIARDADFREGYLLLTRR